MIVLDASAVIALLVEPAAEGALIRVGWPQRGRRMRPTCSMSR